MLAEVIKNVKTIHTYPNYVYFANFTNTSNNMANNGLKLAATKSFLVILSHKTPQAVEDSYS